MVSVAKASVRAPFPYFGGKSAVADVVWRAFGADVSNYVEPFFGSGAILLARPGGAGKLETANDTSMMIVNFWRAIQHEPYAVAAHCDWPVSEVDQNARQRWVVERMQRGTEFFQQMHDDPDYFDAKLAGWWVWGKAHWIGSGWCPEPGDQEASPGHKLPDLYGRGRGRGIRAAAPERDSVEAYAPRCQIPGLQGNKGVNSSLGVTKRPDLHGMGVNTRMMNLGNTRRGVGRDRLPAGHSEIVNALAEELSAGRAPPCFGWFIALADRLRRTRLVCGDWRRVVTPSVLGTTTTRNSGMIPCAVFLDAPYLQHVRAKRLYGTEDDISPEVARWAVEHGDDPDLRIAVCGYESEGHQFPDTWRCHAWKSARGYSNSGKNRGQERIWFSPHCLDFTAPRQPSQLSLLEEH